VTLCTVPKFASNVPVLSSVVLNQSDTRSRNLSVLSNPKFAAEVLQTETNFGSEP
jgi:hypothetical protein